jgi:hypothetical protein
MVKAALVIFISCFLWICGTRVADNGFNRTIALANGGLGNIEIWLPPQLDTSFTWKFVSDHSCGDKIKTRWASSKYSIGKESGEFYLTRHDSLYQFTVSQHANLKCSLPADFSVDGKMLEHRKAYFRAIDVSMAFDIDTIARINGKDFIVLG